MLEFRSGNSSHVTATEAMKECIAKASLDGQSDFDVILIHSTIGHNFRDMLTAARALCPDAIIAGCTASGVIHSEGVTESIRAVAIMAIRGPEVAVSFCKGLTRSNGREIGYNTALELQQKLGTVRQIAVFTAGFNVTGDEVIRGIEDAVGSEVPLFGGTAADNGKAKSSYQFFQSEVVEDGVLLVGFSDATLDLVCVAHHGSEPIGSPFEVTKSSYGHVQELDGAPAWPQVMKRLGLPATTPPADTIPIAGMGIRLPEADQPDYDNTHIIRVPLEADGNGGFYLPTTVPVGTKLELMRRDEDKIFSGVGRMIDHLSEKIGGREIVAVFHSDCMARGRQTFNKILKDEIIAKMQFPLMGDEPRPWLGLYGYSEYCPLNGRNEFHSYTTSIFVMARNRAG